MTSLCLIEQKTNSLVISVHNTICLQKYLFTNNKVRSTSEKVKKWKSEKLLTLALKSFWLIYKSSNFSNQICQYNIKTFIGPIRQKTVQYGYFPYWLDSSQSNNSWIVVTEKNPRNVIDDFMTSMTSYEDFQFET
jgi:hypothetical protein